MTARTSIAQARGLALLAASATLAAALAASPAADAAVPAAAAVEGVLLASGGAAAADGSYDVTFALYAAASGGNAVWSEGPVKVDVKGGRFTTTLGGSKALDAAVLAGLAEAWLGVSIGADPELPRRRLYAAPYALAAATLSCSGCIGGDHLAGGSIAAAKVGFNYAGASTKGGAALDVACTGCVSVAELTFDGDVDLGGNSLKAKNATLSGDLVAKTVTATAFVGDGSKLTGLKSASGSCAKAGEVVKGINADGTLVCVAAMDPKALPADGLNEISNDLLTNQFVDTIATNDKGVAIPDNSGADANSNIDFPDIGLAQAISVSIDIVNTDLAGLAVVLLPPDDKKVGITLCDPCGEADAKELKLTFPPTKSKTGDITTWIGKNPKGLWTLKVKDTAFCIKQKTGNKDLCDVDKQTDGQINDWSIQIQTLSNQKVQAKGALIVDKSVKLGNDNVACTAATAGTIRWNGTSFQGCNGYAFFDMKLFDMKLFVGPGSKQAPAGLTCAAIKKAAADALDGIYWVDPDGGDPANSFQAICDMTSHGGGWTLALNLDTDDGATRHYEDTGFWTANNTIGSPAGALTNDYKGESFGNLPVKELMIKAHREGAQEGTANYSFVGNVVDKTLHWMFNNVSNQTVTGPRQGSSGGVGAAGRARNAGDAFVDNNHAVIFNSTYQPNDASNITRIGTNYGSVCGVINCNGHNYGGLGGRHYRGGWGAYYEAAQLNGYCEAQGVYGDNHSGYNGNNAASGCGYVKRDMDVSVWVR